MGDIAIKVENISKLYQIGDTSSGNLRDAITGLFTSKKNRRTEDFWALDDVSFEVKQGEAVGIIGKNGAGKSTLLKVTSRITEPTKGRIEINGRVSSLLEVGTGFHPELTGRENVFLNGTILGMSRAEVKTKFDEIVDFSGVEKFLDTPVKRYSSGMKVRLAFAVAAHLEPEILIIDEVLAVGDAEFQKKCLGKMKDVAGHGRTILFVSHNMGAVKNLCERSVLLEKGKVKAVAQTGEIIGLYYDNVRSEDTLETIDSLIANLPEDPLFKLLSFKIEQNGIETNSVTNNHPIEIHFIYQVKERTKGLRVYFDLEDNDGNLLIRSFNDETAEAIPMVDPGIFISKAVIPANILAPIQYNISAKATIFNVRPCFHGIKVRLKVYANNKINSGYNDTIRAKLMPMIAWKNTVGEEIPNSK